MELDDTIPLTAQEVERYFQTHRWSQLGVECLACGLTKAKFWDLLVPCPRRFE